MGWEWVRRRRRTLPVVTVLTAWYLVEVAVATTLGVETAVPWFYVTREPVPGYLLAPLSHDIHDLRHLGANVALLLVGGRVAEPRLRLSADHLDEYPRAR